ncbi:MAG: amidohydrolase, partial [Pricia sp.]|nr:amidohydrolase [Pricia sp.]
MQKIVFLVMLMASFTISAQEDQIDKKEEAQEKWDVSNPTGEFNYKEHRFTTDEGTWMNLDISPDGNTIVFDLLGDIYSMPISGGSTTALRIGIPFEVQPRFSPDGKKISFTSDAGGGDNIWIMNSDGSDAKQITKEDFRLLNNSSWMPDGNFFVARKHFTSKRSLGAGEMWQYHITGGDGLQLTKKRNDQQDVNEPNISSNGKYLYYSEDMYPGDAFQYNKDPNKQIYVIKRYEFETGKTITVTGGPGGAARPQVSPNGKILAFIRRVRTKTVLYLHDLETGEEWPIYDDLNKDQQEAWAIFGVYPNFSWHPNNKEIVFWAGGKINKINIDNLTVTPIPFSVDANIKIAETLHFNSPVAPEEFDAKAIRHAVTSPDGNTLVFSALGSIWSKKLPNGKPKRLTQASDFEFEPSFSSDGKQIVYVSWNDENLGAINTISASGGTPKKLTSEKGIYRTPSFNPSDSLITYRKEDGNTDQGRSFTKNTGIYVMSVSDNNPKLISDEGEYPIFTQDGKRIFYQTGGTYFGELTKNLVSVDLNGKDKRTHIKSKYANHLVPSPDNQWIAFTILHKAYIAPLVLNGTEIDLDNKSKTVPVSQISKDAGINLHWSKDSKTIFWTLGDEYFSNDIEDRFTFLPNSPDKVAKPDSVGT